MNREDLVEESELAEFLRSRELLFFLMWRTIKVRYKQTVLGFAWAVIQPFFTMIVFTLLFGKLAKMPSDGAPYPVFYYAALVPWNYFSMALDQSGNSLVNNSHLITKVYFPRLYLPASAVAAGLFDFLIASTLLLGILLFYGVPLTPRLLLWPMLVMPLALLAMGVGSLLAALNVYYRDLKYTIPFMVQLLLFVSPVIYPASMIPERYRWLAALNPVGGIIQSFRAAAIPTKEMPWASFGISFAVTVVVLVVGVLSFRKAERQFADVV